MNRLNQTTKEEVLNRLNNLTETSEGKWGKMSPAEMLWHSNQVIGIPLDKVRIKPNPIIKLLFGKLIKKQVLASGDYKPSSPTAPEFKIRGQKFDFETEKNHLIQNINEFVNKSDAELDKTVHQLFGKMTADEWRISQWKHLNHHFNQFGV